MPESLAPMYYVPGGSSEGMFPKVVPEVCSGGVIRSMIGTTEYAVLLRSADEGRGSGQFQVALDISPRWRLLELARVST